MDNNEITVLVEVDLEELYKILNKNKFKKMNVFQMNDIYLLKSELFNELSKTNILETLNNSIIIRNIITNAKNLKLITYKKKEYNKNKEIINQKKIECEIVSIDDALKLFNSLNYIELIRIESVLEIFNNGEVELVIQKVGENILIEIEENEKNNIENLKEIIRNLNIPIKNNDFFIKKAEMMIKEKFF